MEIINKFDDCEYRLNVECTFRFIILGTWFDYDYGIHEFLKGGANVSKSS